MKLNWHLSQQAHDLKLVDKTLALASGGDALVPSFDHLVLNRSMTGPWPEGTEIAAFALGCFWGAERLFWQLPGVWVTAVGYCAGFTKHPRYKQVCSGQTGHTEAVLLVYTPEECSFETLLRSFWQAHDPTQGMRQGNDVGTQYRSGIYVSSEAQRVSAEQSKQAYQAALKDRGFGSITTEIKGLDAFYYAEDEHQQYLARNPQGYCGLRGTGVVCEFQP
ncbi:peptide-methionine (S)-S-oxide reductase MsrA [Agaribacterium sp. ZY112]|uniref:peptide-methionine (S)-S-oxide reductase MsrA n=1 Tax=Agaribacterium sp. ZY112 TaxID=3233574 RepID=UPI0035244289